MQYDSSNTLKLPWDYLGKVKEIVGYDINGELVEHQWENFGQYDFLREIYKVNIINELESKDLEVPFELKAK